MKKKSINQIIKNNKKPNTNQKKDDNLVAGLYKENSDAVVNSLRYYLIENIIKMYPEVSKELVEKKVIFTKPANDSFGDYSTNIALVLAGSLGVNPKKISEEIAEKINEDIKIKDNREIKSKTGKDIGLFGLIERAEVAGAGFVNVWLSESIFSTYLTQLLSGENHDRIIQTITQTASFNLVGKKIAVEYTDPNPFKEFHLGHLYSNVIGESISRLLEGAGAKVWRGDFYGDVGMHVAKSVWGMRKKIKDQKLKIKDLERLSINQRQKFLGQGYALGVREYEKDKKIQEEVRNINSLIYVAAQEILERDRGWKPIIDYKKYLKVKGEEYNELKEIYEAGLKWSLSYFEAIYKILGTKFDGYYPESWVGEYGIEMVKEGLKKGVLEDDYGVVVYRGEKEGLHTRVFVNKLGLPTYEAKDLGLTRAKYNDFKYDLSINIFGKEIDEYYKVVRSALRKIDPELGVKAEYVAHGMVNLPEGKMSSRTGNVVTFEMLLDELKEYALAIMKDSDLEDGEKEMVAQRVGMAAVRYALLKSNIGNDVVFDFEKSVSFEGDSGPYIMYTYARAKSVIRKSEIRNPKSEIVHNINNIYQSISFDPSTGSGFRTSHEEKSVVRTLFHFPEVVMEAGRNLSPNLLCGYLFDLAQRFNLFYNKHSILGIRNQESGIRNNADITSFRIALTDATAEVIKNGLYILGIQTVERM